MIQATVIFVIALIIIGLFNTGDNSKPPNLTT